MFRALLALLFLLQAHAARVAVFGDWGADTPGRVQVAALLRNAHGKQPLLALLTVGDNFYPRGQVVERFLQDLPTLPLYPAFGNHDAPALAQQLRRFGLAKPFYRLRLGALEFFFLYTEASLREQKAWLQEALATSSAPWRVVVLHRPLYSSGLHGGSPLLRSLLEPLLRRAEVPLVLAGHDHHYERLRVGPTTHLVLGGGGAPLYPTRVPLPFSQSLNVAHHALFLEATETTLQGYALDPEGRVLDRFLLKRGSP
ncbi:acid phosphatase [Thermus sp. LT1-2-5]|uniref:metallophosphoesterase n=1 Tax=Thermus sp. LT1-2-5 TaxID=3026935 RepID=UPI0030EA7078